MILKKANLGHKWTSLEGSTSVPVISTAVDSPTTEKDHAENAAAKAAVTFIPVYPTSSRSGPKDWDKVTADLIRESRKEGKDNGDGRTEADLDELEEEGGDPVNAFFKKIYADADPDTRRAMMKSYQESSGTTLSTNWSEVSQGTVDTSPPDGMVARKWNE